MDMNGNKKFMTFRFNSVLIRFPKLLSIFVSLGMQTTHLSHDKNDTTNLLSCDITPIFFSAEPIPNLRYHSPSHSPLPTSIYRKQVALQSIKL